MSWDTAHMSLLISTFELNYVTEFNFGNNWFFNLLFVCVSVRTSHCRWLMMYFSNVYECDGAQSPRNKTTPRIFHSIRGIVQSLRQTERGGASMHRPDELWLMVWRRRESVSCQTTWWITGRHLSTLAGPSTLRISQLQQGRVRDYLIPTSDIETSLQANSNTCNKTLP